MEGNFIAIAGHNIPVDQYVPALIDDQRKRVRDPRMEHTMIRYEELCRVLNALHEDNRAELDAAKGQIVEGECCVCLDDLGCAANVTRTRCGHLYHTRCLVETLAGGMIKSCPMCRTGIREITSNDLSGKSFRFMCLLRINSDTVQSCSRMLKNEIEAAIDVCEEEARELGTWRLLKRLTKARRDLLKARLFRVRTRLQLLEQYSEANVHGFADILRQIGHVLSKELQEPATVECHTKMDIFTDTDQSGAYMRMAQRLRSIMKLVGVDKAAILVHEQKLQQERGLASPSVSEAHFALETWDDDVRDKKNYMAHCFVGLCGASSAQRELRQRSMRERGTSRRRC